ncbi:MAG: 5-formyltetrahydrofolate cyclo-ligase [Treponema sp.]|nr:5-formyltetrahydrofolate cyclo-ligase [Candidatus Treponema caballi]
MSVEKTALRAVIRTRLRELNADKSLAAEKSRRASAVLTESDAYKNAGAVLAFLSFGTEIKTYDLVKQMLADGKRVAIPRTFESEGDDARMEFYWLSADAPLEEQVEKGDFGILVPRESLPMVDPAALPEKTLMVLPGVAFSKAGWRLGQGRGFYDRYLERVSVAGPKSVRLAGFCYVLQLVDDVPHDTWDKPVDCIITEDGAFYMRPR